MYRSKLGGKRGPDRSHRAARADDNRRARRRLAARNGRRDEHLGAEPAQNRPDQRFRPLDAAEKPSRSKRRNPRFPLRYEKVVSLLCGGPPKAGDWEPEPASRARSCPWSVPPVAPDLDANRDAILSWLGLSQTPPKA